LQHSIGVFKKVFEFVALGAEHFCGELRGNLDARDRGVLRHVANFVDLDTGLAGEGRLDLLGKC
jgi:hypothetical protein